MEDSDDKERMQNCGLREASVLTKLFMCLQPGKKTMISTSRSLLKATIL